MTVCLYSCLSYPTYTARLFHAALYCHLWRVMAVPYFSTLSHKRQDFGGEKT